MSADGFDLRGTIRTVLVAKRILRDLFVATKEQAA